MQDAIAGSPWHNQLNMKLLLSESSTSEREKRARWLRNAGHLCEQAESLVQAYRKVIKFEYDGVLLVVDDEGGPLLPILELLRTEHPRCLCLVLAAQTSVAQRIEWLDHGADDVVPSSIDREEILARLRAIMRRRSQQADARINLGRLLLLPEERRVIADGHTLKLTRKEYDLLLYLATNKNRVVTKERLAEQIWGEHSEDVETFDFLYAHLKNLRRKLQQHDCQDYLRTIYGVGYKLEG